MPRRVRGCRSGATPAWGAKAVDLIDDRRPMDARGEKYERPLFPPPPGSDWPPLQTRPGNVFERRSGGSHAP